MKVSVLRLSRTSENKYLADNGNDKKIIDGILQNSNPILTELYRQNFTGIKKMVWSFNNTILDPEDVFQEGLTRAILNIRAGKFRGESSFSTYLNGICRNICLKQLSKNNMKELLQSHTLADEENHFELLNSLLVVKEELEPNCRRIIDLRFALSETSDDEEPNKCPSFDEISELLGLSAANARQRFKRCLDKLRELVSQSPDLNEYFS